MGLDLWFQQDVARILAATHETMAASVGAVSPLESEVADAYQRGFVDALRAVAVAFGVYPPGITPEGTWECHRPAYESIDEAMIDG